MGNLLDLPFSFLLLVPVSVAAGVDFFLTLLVLAVIQGWGLAAGADAGGVLLWGGIVGSLTLLYIMEALAEVRAGTALLWHTLQLVLRPVGGALLALTVLDGFPLWAQLLGSLGAGVVCAFTHVLSWGRKFLIILPPRPRGSTFSRIVGEDLLVFGLVVAALEWPGPVFLTSLALLLMGLLIGTSTHHAVRFGTLVFRSKVLGFLDPPGWTEEADLPHWVRRAAEVDSLMGIRGVRGGLYPPPGVRGFRECWVLQTDRGPDILLKFRGKPRILPLRDIGVAGEEETGLARQILLEGDEGSRSALFLQREFSGLKSHK